MKRLLPLLIGLGFIPASAAVLYVAPNGSAAQPGTGPDHPTRLEHALEQVQPGDTVFLRGGRYLLSSRLQLKRSGTAAAPIRLARYQDETPVIDASRAGNSCALLIEGGHYHLQGLEITNAYNQGVLIHGSHNVIERCVAHHNGGTGFAVTLNHGEKNNADGERAAYNRFLFCDSYLNFDWYKRKADGQPRPGTDADGFASSLSSGKGNAFHGCRAWSNSDDGWDCFESGFGVVVENCWTWRNGVWSDFAEIYQAKTGTALTAEGFKGDGNGFKLGGNHSTGGNTCSHPSRGLHVLRNSIAFQNRSRGIDQNNHQDGMVVENNLSFDNGTDIHFWKQPNPGRPFIFRNNAIFGGKKKSSIGIPAVSENNTWQGTLTASASDFESLALADATAPRGPGGALPPRFGRLRPNSPLVDAGVKTQPVRDTGFEREAIPFLGAAPDIGPCEAR